MLRKQIVHERILVFVSFHLLYLLIPLGLTILPFFLLSCHSVVLRTFGVLIPLAWACTFDGSHKKAGKPWEAVVNNPVINLILSWLPVCIRRTTKLNPNELYVFACHPHGALAFNRAAVGFSTYNLWNRAFPGVNFRVLTASAAFFVPFIREMWLWSYCVDASKKTAVYVLEKLRCSIFVYPGGEKEQLETIRGRQILYLRERKGFVKLAIQQGASLVPVYAFGESQLYNHFQFGIKQRKWLAKTFGVAIPLISGQYGLQPYRNNVTLVFGAPIKTPHIENPSDEELNTMHALYIAHLEKLFEDHKESLGYGDAVLEIL